ncbi:MAG: ABC transporter substrate-binding protein [Actinomycetota bacterium]|nr:ABC transporter substrate-binding protein [Actinomycetota bacterium]
MLLVASCTNGDDSGDPDGPPAVEGNLKVGLPGPIALDPSLASLAEASELLTVDLLYDGLTSLDPEGTPIPGLATTWDTDAEQRLWRFRLDADRTFASGRPITPADVVASLTWLARRGDTSLAALRLEAITGFRALVDGTAPTLEGVRVAEDGAVEIALDTPLSTLPVLLAGPSYGIVDPNTIAAAATTGVDAVDPTGGWTATPTTGGGLVLEERPGSPGRLDALELVPHEDAGGAYAAFEAGEVDWAEVPDGRVGDAVEAYGDDAFAPFHAELYFGLNLRSATLTNDGLRTAIARAVDRDAIVGAVYPDLALPLSQVVPAGVPGRAADPCATCGFDPAAARSALEEAFPDGNVPIVPIDFDQSPAQEAMARIVADNLDAVGIPTELRPRPIDEYKQFVVGGAHELFSFGWIGAYASPDAYLAPLFASASDDNLVGVASEDLDELLLAARAHPPGAENLDRWAQAERRLLEAAVVVPIAQFRTLAVVSDRVAGWEHRVDGTIDWSAVSLGEGASR